MLINHSRIGSYFARDPNYAGFRSAFIRDHKDAKQHSLSHAFVFNYADAHPDKYSISINYFITEKLTACRAQKEAIEQQPHALFDIKEANEAQLLFYILRNLIRRNEPGFQNDIVFLLNIPSIKALAHTEATAGAPNELLQLAREVNNQGAAELLLDILALRQFAEANDDSQRQELDGFDSIVLTIATSQGLFARANEPIATPAPPKGIKRNRDDNHDDDEKAITDNKKPRIK